MKAQIALPIGAAPSEKYCPRCQRALAREQFGNHRARPDGKCSWCLDCSRIQQRERLAKFRERDPEAIDLTLPKRCFDCKIYQPRAEFYRNRSASDGCAPRCKPCTRVFNARWQREHKAATNARNRKSYRRHQGERDARNREYAHAHPEVGRANSKAHNERMRTRDRRASLIVQHARARAVRRGHEFAITAADIVLPEVCPVLGIPIDYDVRGKPGPASPSLDRIDNAKGYVPGNVKVISHRANVIKGMGNADEHRKIAAYIDENIG